MTEQVKRFLDRYFETLKGKDSAIYAGFSEKTAVSQASQMLSIDENEKYLTKLREDYSLKHGINKDRVLNEYRKIAFSDIRNILTVDGGLKAINELDDDTAGAIAGIESFDENDNQTGEKLGTNRKIKMHDKMKALDSLSKHLGLFEKDNSQKIETKKQVIIVNGKEIEF